MIRNIGVLDNLQFVKRAEQQVYRHFLYSTKTEDPDRTLRRFHDLFIRGTGYENNEIRLAVENIVNSAHAETEFAFFLNRCCHIIINRWQMHPQFKTEIPNLVAKLKTALPPGGTSSRSSRKIRQLVGNFQSTEHYLKLQRLVRLSDPDGEYKSSRSVDVVENSIGDSIQRYPYLHQHCLLSEDSDIELEQTIKTIQSDLQKNYELSLAQYITARVCLKQLVREYKAKNQTKIPKSLVKSVKNPTLLSDRELDYSLRHYMGKVEQNFTYRDLSLNFINYSSELRTYKTFKQELEDYLVSGIEGNYGRRLKSQISRCLWRTLPDFDVRQPDEFLKLRTCSQLFKFLVVDGKNNPNHNLYLDLIANLGETQTIGLLLKLVLPYYKVKPYLEQRFSLLFSYYENEAEDTAMWLVKSLENLQVAFSVHFGDTDFSLIKII
ncbi:hypothetical protein [Myxosarcina sp. GI1]|uniref:hypothetical protein n=1 Tax=Myxosarcina sp. GI1 TaxID=1541065 RepID=UPI000564F451|nr:hypothetical protein [Myxosarcina sp. GI1]